MIITIYITLCVVLKTKKFQKQIEQIEEIYVLSKLVSNPFDFFLMFFVIIWLNFPYQVARQPLRLASEDNNQIQVKLYLAVIVGLDPFSKSLSQSGIVFKQA